jgi:hypothetical protein
MSRKLVWIEQPRFRGFGCSECGWRFKPCGTPTGKSFHEMMRNFESQRDKELHPMFAAITDPDSVCTAFGIKPSDGVEDFYTSACPTREPGARPAACTNEYHRK